MGAGNRRYRLTAWGSNLSQFGGGQSWVVFRLRPARLLATHLVEGPDDPADGQRVAALPRCTRTAQQFDHRLAESRLLPAQVDQGGLKLGQAERLVLAGVQRVEGEMVIALRKIELLISAEAV